MRMWLARDSAVYIVSPKKFAKLASWYDLEFEENDFTHQIDPKYWHRLGGLRLKPGEGPVQVELTIACKRRQ